MRHIETKQGLERLLAKMDKIAADKPAKDLPEYDYWYKVVKGCIEEGLAMDETDYELAPRWFRNLWTGLK